MEEGTIQFVISLRGGSEAAGQARKVEQAVAGVGGKMRQVSSESERAAKHTGALGGSLKHLAIGLGAVGAGYAAWNAAKGAIRFTEDLAVNTRTLSKATGMSVGQTSNLVAVSGALGVESSKLGMVFAKLGKATVAQAEATGKHVTAFDRLGISQQFAKEHLNDTAGVLDLVTKNLAERHIPAAEKAVLMTELFGRGWKALGPLLLEGEAGLSGLTKMAKEFGLEIGSGGAESLHKFHEQQVESKLAMEGLQVSFTKLVAGPLGGVLSGFARLSVFARKKDWGGFNREVDKIAHSFEVLVEKVLPKVAESFARVAPAILKAFWRGFIGAPIGAQLVLGLALAAKFGLTKAIFGGIAGGIMKAMVVRMVAGSSVSAVAGAGTELGGAFGAAFQAAAVIGIAAVVAYGAYKLGMALRGAEHAEDINADTGKHMSKGETNTFLADQARKVKEAEAHAPAAVKRGIAHERGIAYAHHHPKAADGAMVRHPGLVEVGERGPELVHLPRNAVVDPLKPGSLVDNRPLIVQIDGREIARVNRRQQLESQAAGA